MTRRGDYLDLYPFNQHLEHLSVPHLNRQEHHDERRQPDSTRAQPQNTRALRLEQLRACVRRHDTRNATQTRQHTANTAAVARVKEFGGRGVEDRIEVLGFVSQGQAGREEEEDIQSA